jgi:hypothetical protein
MDHTQSKLAPTSQLRVDRPHAAVLMGKKKSKTAKQGAARAASRHSAAFVKKLGIAPTKCFDKKSQRSDALVPVDSIISKPRTLQPKSRSDTVRISNKVRFRNSALDRSEAGTQPSRPRPTPREGDEQSEFDRQLRSLNERRGVEEVKKRTRSIRAFAPVPESFSSLPTTAQILDSTTRQIQALDGLGELVSRQEERVSEVSATGLMISSAYWSSANPIEQALNERNPWAALEDDSEDERNAVDDSASTLYRGKPFPHKSQPFQFQPATFLTQDKTSNMSLPSCQGGYDDPEL